MKMLQIYISALCCLPVFLKVTLFLKHLQIIFHSYVKFISIVIAKCIQLEQIYWLNSFIHLLSAYLSIAIICNRFPICLRWFTHKKKNLFSVRSLFFGLNTYTTSTYFDCFISIQNILIDKVLLFSSLLSKTNDK